ncbi:MAG: hypothetical protein IAF00_11140, partial [Phycisphaerales bacterium]|nr:hypothetical protein [Phycisphaerales bacterium]
MRNESNRFLRYTLSLILLGFVLNRGGWAAETALDRYVAKADPNYSYNLYHT